MARAQLILSRVREKRSIPRQTSELKKTSSEMCWKCIYSIPFESGSHTPACYYYIRTGKDRACPIGWCDKFEAGKKKKHEWMKDLKAMQGFSDRRSYDT